jgi:short-subunit dehydrogenase
MTTTLKKVMITGASEGIGRAFAHRLAADGYAVTATARNESRLQELMTELDADCHTYQVADLSTAEGAGTVAEILSGGRFHQLKKNAGFSV